MRSDEKSLAQNNYCHCMFWPRSGVACRQFCKRMLPAFFVVAVVGLAACFLFVGISGCFLQETPAWLDDFEKKHSP